MAIDATVALDDLTVSGGGTLDVIGVRHFTRRIANSSLNDYRERIGATNSDARIRLLATNLTVGDSGFASEYSIGSGGDGVKLFSNKLFVGGLSWNTDDSGLSQDVENLQIAEGANSARE